MYPRQLCFSCPAAGAFSVRLHPPRRSRSAASFCRVAVRTSSFVRCGWLTPKEQPPLQSPPALAASTCSASPNQLQNEASLDYSSPAAEHNDDAVSLAAPVTISAADVLLVAVFFASCAAPVLRAGQKPPPARVFIALALFIVQSLLYVLRVRALRHAFRAAQRRQGGIEARLERRLVASEGRAAAVAQTTSRDMSIALAAALADHRAEAMQVSSRARAEQDVQYAELVASIRERDNDTRTAIADVRTALDALTSAAREERTAHRRAADADARALASERALQDARANESRALEDARNAGAQRATDAAVAREAALRAEADALRRAAEDAPALRERLLAAQARVAALEERASIAPIAKPVSEAPGALVAPSDPPAPARALRDALFTLGKTFPSAGRILFDPPIEPPRRPPTRPPAQLGWPDDALGTRSPAAPEDVGLPDDGGFGTNHFSNAAGQPPTIGAADASPFSTLRGAFSEDGDISASSVDVESQSSASGIADESTGSVNLSGSATADNSSAAKEELASSQVLEVSKAEALDVPVDGAIAEKQTTGAVDYLKTLEKGAAQAPSEAPSATTPDQISVEAATEVPADAPAAEIEGVVVAEESVEELLAAARDLVNRGRRKEVSVSESLNKFESADQKFRMILAKQEDNLQVKGEYGLALLAWARRDLSGDLTKDRLEQACTMLRSCVEAEAANEGWLFNLGLSLCLLASLQEPPECEALYKEASVHYDTLVSMNDKSRIVFFNGGLAYISRARIAESAERKDDALVIEMYTKASKRFSSALELSPDDSKCKSYLTECEEQLKVLLNR